MPRKIPKKVPEKTFYYHYKHDTDKGVNDHAYEVIGVGYHTEEDCRPEDIHMVVYLPLYKSSRAYQAGKLFELRPLEMFMGNVTKDGKTFPRFKKITDENIITQLKIIKTQLYS